MEIPHNFQNKTALNFAHAQRKRKIVFSTPAYHLSLVGGMALLVLTVVCAFLHIPRLSVPCLLLALGLCWFFPIKSYWQFFSLGGEVLSEFDEKGFQIEETTYPYSRMNRIYVERDWVVFEFPKKVVVMDAKGFEDITCDELISCLRREHPEIPVKWRKNAPTILPLVLLSALGIVLTVFGFCLKPAAEPTIDTPPVAIVPTTRPTVNKEATHRINDSRLLADPLKTTDFNYFRMDIPEGLSMRSETDEGGGIFTIRYFNQAELLLLYVRFLAKDGAFESSVAEVAQSCSLFYKPLNGIYISEAGNYCFEFTGVDTGVGSIASGYLFCLDVGPYYVAVHTTCPDEAFDEYLPHFKKWESSVVMNDPPTGEFLN